MQEFCYEGTPISKLESVLKIKDYVEQLNEIEGRLHAIYQWCMETNTAMSKLHVTNVLAISPATFTRLARGIINRGSTQAMTPQQAGKSEVECAFIAERAELLKKWMRLAEMHCLNKVSNDTIPARAIYLAKTLYGYWDTPQSDKSTNSISIELVLNKKKQNTPLRGK